jgi:hypothetical protein
MQCNCHGYGMPIHAIFRRFRVSGVRKDTHPTVKASKGKRKVGRRAGKDATLTSNNRGMQCVCIGEGAPPPPLSLSAWSHQRQAAQHLLLHSPQLLQGTKLTSRF